MMKTLVPLLLIVCSLGLLQGCCCDARYSRCCTLGGYCRASGSKWIKPGSQSFCQAEGKRHRHEDDGDDDDDDDNEDDECCCGGGNQNGCGCCGIQNGAWGNGLPLYGVQQGVISGFGDVSPAANCASCAAGGTPGIGCSGCVGGMPMAGNCAGTCAAASLPPGSCATGHCAAGVVDGMVIDGSSGWTLSAPSPNLVEPIPAPPTDQSIAPAPPPAPAPPVPGTASSKR
jgi:hypothetical protein